MGLVPPVTPRLVRPLPCFRAPPQALSLVVQGPLNPRLTFAAYERCQASANSPSGAFVFDCHNEKYGCLATAKSGDIWTGTRSDIALTPNTQQPETHTAYSGEALWAWGIKFIRVGHQDLYASADRLY